VKLNVGRLASSLVGWIHTHMFILLSPSSLVYKVQIRQVHNNGLFYFTSVNGMKELGQVQFTF
jgi:hypothetical protein